MNIIKYSSNSLAALAITQDEKWQQSRNKIWKQEWYDHYAGEHTKKSVDTIYHYFMTGDLLRKVKEFDLRDALVLNPYLSVDVILDLIAFFSFSEPALQSFFLFDEMDIRHAPEAEDALFSWFWGSQISLQHPFPTVLSGEAVARIINFESSDFPFFHLKKTVKWLFNPHIKQPVSSRHLELLFSAFALSPPEYFEQAAMSYENIASWEAYFCLVPLLDAVVRGLHWHGMAQEEQAARRQVLANIQRQIAEHPAWPSTCNSVLDLIRTGRLLPIYNVTLTFELELSLHPLWKNTLLKAARQTESIQDDFFKFDYWVMQNRSTKFCRGFGEIVNIYAPEKMPLWASLSTRYAALQHKVHWINQSGTGRMTIRIPSQHQPIELLQDLYNFFSNLPVSQLEGHLEPYGWDYVELSY